MENVRRDRDGNELLNSVLSQKLKQSATSVACLLTRVILIKGPGAVELTGNQLVANVSLSFAIR